MASPRYDTKEDIDKYITQAGSSCFGQYHCTSRPTVVRGGSQRVATTEDEAGEHEEQQLVEQNTKGDDDREAGNQDLQLVTESGFQDLDMQIAKPSARSYEEMLTKAKIVAAPKMKPR